MKEQLISFETAKLAKEKGFNVFSRAQYFDENGDEWLGFSSNMDDYEDKYNRPTQSLLQKWLREEHNIIVESLYAADMGGRFCYKYLRWGEPHTISSTYSTTYEEALEKGLQEALKLIN